MAWTRSQIRTRLRRKLSELSAGTWSDSELNDAIHDGERKVCEECFAWGEHSLIEGLYKTARVANQWQYPLPDDCIDILLVEHFYNGEYVPLIRQPIRDLHTGFKPSVTSDYLEFFEISGRMRVVLGSGTATGGGTAISLQDTAVDFTTWDIAVGDIAFNVADDSEAVVSIIAAHAVTTTALEGGADNLWSVGDSYQIEEIEATLDVLNVFPCPSTSDDIGIESIRLTYPCYPREMQTDTDKTEVPQYAMDALYYAAIVVAFEKSTGVSSVEVANMQKRLEYEIGKISQFMTQRGKTNYNAIKDRSLWGAG